MPRFPCPSCIKPIEAADEFVGKSILCPHCQRAATVPNAAITAADVLPMFPTSTGLTTPEIADAQEAKRRRAAEDFDVALPKIRRDDARRSWLNVGLWILFWVVVLSILVALLVPATEKVREASARTQSTNNLKNIILSFHGFHDVNNRLPFNGSDVAVDGVEYEKKARRLTATSGSWGFQIMPYIDANPFFAEPEKHPDISVAPYLCPGRGRPPGGAWTDFFYNNYLNDPKQAAKPDAVDSRRNLKSITDGTSDTIFVGHGNIDTRQYGAAANVTLSTNVVLGGTVGTMRAGENGESAPRGVVLKHDFADAPGIGNWGGPYPTGALMAMGDGTVRMFPYSTQNFSSFLTPTGGEAVAVPD